MKPQVRRQDNGLAEVPKEGLASLFALSVIGSIYTFCLFCFSLVVFAVSIRQQKLTRGDSNKTVFVKMKIFNNAICLEARSLYEGN